MISNFQQTIYNTFLRISRKDKPFKYRKNFNNLDDLTQIYLQKLENFFNYFKYINIDDFFIAPYKILNCDGYYDLKFYLSLKAKKCYTLYMNNKKNNDITLEELKNNLQFILTFCKQNHIKIENYINFKINNIYAFLHHFKNNQIHLNVLFAFDDFEKNLKNTNNDILLLMFGDFFNNIEYLRLNYYNSKYKDIIKKGLLKLNETCTI